METAPTYFDWMLFEHRVLDDSTYKPTEQQLKAAREGREKKIFPGLSAERERMVAEAYKGMTLSEFEAYVRAFMQLPQPGYTGLKRGDAYYKPMVEVVKFLTANGFTVYVNSGTDASLLNYALSENKYRSMGFMLLCDDLEREYGITDLVPGVVNTKAKEVKVTKADCEKLKEVINEHSPKVAILMHSKVRNSFLKYMKCDKTKYGKIGKIIEGCPTMFYAVPFPHGNKYPKEMKINI